MHISLSRNFVFGSGKGLPACIFLSEWHSYNPLLEISLYIQLSQKCPLFPPVGCLPPQTDCVFRHVRCLPPIFLHFCAGTRKRPLVPAAKRRISFGGHTGPWLPGYGSGRGGQGQDSGGSCLGCRRERRRQLAQLPLECKDSAGCCLGGGSGGPGRLGLKQDGSVGWLVAARAATARAERLGRRS